MTYLKGLLIVLMGLFIISGCTGSVSKAPEPSSIPPAFEVANMTITPKEVKPGEKVNISMLVTNTGSSKGNYVAELKLNDIAETTNQISLAAKESQTVNFTITRDKPGTFKVTLGGLSGQFTVSQPIPQKRTWVFKESLMNRIVTESVEPEIKTKIMAGNKISFTYIGTTLTYNLIVKDGKFGFASFPYISSWVRIEQNEKWIKWIGDDMMALSFPAYLDTRKEIAPDVDKFPVWDSISTNDGEIILTYTWPQ